MLIEKGFELKGLRLLLLSLSLIGFIVFGGLFGATYAKQDHLEQAAQGFIKHHIKLELTERYPEVTRVDIPDRLKDLQQKYSDEADRIKVMIDAKVDVIIADAISKLCGDNCDRKEARRESFRDLFEHKFERASQASTKITTFIEGKYTETLSELRRDFRVFSGVNSVAFLTVFLALLFKHRARVHLLLPSTLLILSALISIYFYIFQQNWFFTLLHGSYWGFAYAVYMGVIFIFLLDIVVNKGRVTTTILNGISNVSVSLC